MVSFLGFSAAGILGVFTTMDWFDVRSSAFLIVGDTPVEDLRNSVAATAVSYDCY